VERSGTLLHALKDHWRYFAWFWAYPFFLGFVCSPLEARLPAHGHTLFWLLSAPAFVFSVFVASLPYFRRRVTALQHIVLMSTGGSIFMIVTICLKDVLSRWKY
jgi:hypothetical protein